jgi:hypothetical protein
MIRTHTQAESERNQNKTANTLTETTLHYAAGRATLPLKNETLERKTEDREQTQRRNWQAKRTKTVSPHARPAGTEREMIPGGTWRSEPT